jgi:hypothetical protein
MYRVTTRQRRVRMKEITVDIARLLLYIHKETGIEMEVILDVFDAGCLYLTKEGVVIDGINTVNL